MGYHTVFLSLQKRKFHTDIIVFPVEIWLKNWPYTFPLRPYTFMSTPRERKKGSKSDWSSWSIFLYIYLHLTFEGTIQDQLASCSLGLFHSTGFRNFSFENNCWLYCIQGGFLNSKLFYDHHQGSSGVKVDGPSKTEVEVAPSISSSWPSIYDQDRPL